MANKKVKDQAASLLDDPELGVIETTIELDSVQLKSKRWYLKIGAKTILPRSYHRYRVCFDFDEEPFNRRITDLEKQLDDSLFKEERISRRQTSKNITEIRAQLEKQKKECGPADFGAEVISIKYDGPSTDITFIIPDDVIDWLNKQKFRMDAYKVKLIPLL